MVGRCQTDGQYPYRYQLALEDLWREKRKTKWCKQNLGRSATKYTAPNGYRTQDLYNMNTLTAAASLDQPTLSGRGCSLLMNRALLSGGWI